ncbi:MAG TPA: ABC transporter permease [Candidatus Limnocylindrales bacterium]|jgi:peptide/nickel transport system permease protein|nr:ABC transporter permease [Candidatus Limnocylindrales bacterium]
MSASTTTAAGLAPPRASRGLWGDAARRLVRNGPALIGLTIIAIFVVAAILAPVIAPFEPLQRDAGQVFKPPSPTHLMGTDRQARDVFSRILFGAQISLLVGVVSVLMGVTMGGTVGAIAGAFGGRVDAVLMRIVDVLLAIPGILLAIGIVVWLDRGLIQIMFAVAATNAPIFARILRGSMLALRESDYVTAARSMGASTGRLLLRHMLPNALTPIIVASTLALATAIIDVAGLGFLGLGPPDPRTAEWGTMLTGATSFYRQAPWIIFFTGAAISISAIGFNLLGDGLRESLDPRLKR